MTINKYVITWMRVRFWSKMKFKVTHVISSEPVQFQVVFIMIRYNLPTHTDTIMYLVIQLTYYT